MLKAILTVGVSGSGKTTWAEEYCRKHKYININRDDLRSSLLGLENREQYNHNRKFEELITQVQQDIALNSYKANKNIIISDTNLNPVHRDNLSKFLGTVGFKVEYKKFPVEWAEAVKRDRLRRNSVGYEIINNQWKRWLEFIDFKKYTPSKHLPEAVIVDVDGTLAERGDRSPFDWNKVKEDKRIDIVSDMVAGLYSQDYNIIIVSGRDGVCETDTREWLDNNTSGYDAFFMRKPGDKRPDWVVKNEIFWDHIADEYNVMAVIDDRPQVCRMWRDLGLKVIQVADPYQEF